MIFKAHAWMPSIPGPQPPLGGGPGHQPRNRSEGVVCNPRCRGRRGVGPVPHRDGRVGGAPPHRGADGPAPQGGRHAFPCCACDVWVFVRRVGSHPALAGLQALAERGSAMTNMMQTWYCRMPGRGCGAGPWLSAGSRAQPSQCVLTCELDANCRDTKSPRWKCGAGQHTRPTANFFCAGQQASDRLGV